MHLRPPAAARRPRTAEYSSVVPPDSRCAPRSVLIGLDLTEMLVTTDLFLKTIPLYAYIYQTMITIRHIDHTVVHLMEKTLANGNYPHAPPRIILPPPGGVHCCYNKLIY